MTCNDCRNSRSGSTISKLLILYNYNCKTFSSSRQLDNLNIHWIAYAFTILLTSYIMGGIGVLLAFLIMVLYFQRLVLHHQPAKEVRTIYHM